jgi:putative ABC transport system permease protein
LREHSRDSQPPIVARRLLLWLVPRERQAEILGDLEEEFHERGASWYWRQALRFSIYFLARSPLELLKRAGGALTEPGHVSVRQSLRSLRRSPAFSLLVIGMMAIGVGLNTAIFSLVYGILLRPFPYRDPDALVRVASLNQRNGNQAQNSWPDLEDWRAHNRTFVDLALYVPFQTELRGDGPAESVRMAWITPELFAVLGVDAAIGRSLRPEEGRIGAAAHKALISHHLWQTAFGGRPDILDQSLDLPTTVYPIVGVMPKGFRFPDATDIWIPMASGVTVATAVDPERMRANRSCAVVGRLRPGITMREAQADLARISTRMEQDHPVANRDIRPIVTTLRDAEVGKMRPYLMLLVGSVGLVLLLCCVNVASLFLSRTTARVRELSIRVALGAGGAIIVRQLLIESFFLCACGGLAGAGLAAVSIRLFNALIPIALPFWMRIELDSRVWASTGAVSAATAVLFGVIPAWRTLQESVSGSLRSGRGASAGTGVERARAALVVLEVAFSVALVATAGLLIRSFVTLQRTPTGFDARGVITAHISPFRPGTLAAKQAGYSTLYRRVIEELEAVPGVTSVAGIDGVPFRNASAGRRVVDVMASGTDASRAGLFARVTSVSPRYFGTMGIPLTSGRDFDARDVLEAEPVVIVSARAAATLFPSMPDALGRALCFDQASPRQVCHRVVGIVGDVRYSADDAPEGAEVYFPIAQRAPGAFDFVVRTRTDPAAMMAAMRTAVARIDKDTAVVQVRSVAAIIDDALWQQRVSGALLTTFAAVSLAVAAVGLFEVMAYLVSLRTREIGIRLALGARQSAVVRLVVRRGVALTVAGLAIGLALAQLAARWTSAVLFGVSAHDPATLAGVALLFLTVATVACIVPVWRAAHIDPCVTLRQE